MIEVRKMRVSDWETIQVMLQAVVDERPPVALELEALATKSKEWLASFPRDSDQGYFIVMEHNKKIVAFCYLAVPKFYQSVAYIGIVVKKKYRREDIGTQLFYHVAEWASRKHLAFIAADVWSWNLHSIKFFKKLGFKEQLRFQDKFKGEEKAKIRLLMKL